MTINLELAAAEICLLIRGGLLRGDSPNLGDDVRGVLARNKSGGLSDADRKMFSNLKCSVDRLNHTIETLHVLWPPLRADKK